MSPSISDPHGYHYFWRAAMLSMLSWVPSGGEEHHLHPELKDHDPIMDQDFIHSHYVLLENKGGTGENPALLVLSWFGCVQQCPFGVCLLAELIPQTSRTKRTRKEGPQQPYVNQAKVSLENKRAENWLKSVSLCSKFFQHCAWVIFFNCGRIHFAPVQIHF